MLAVSSQTFEDSCRMAKRNSLESATLSLNLFQGFILRFVFVFFGEMDVKSEAPPSPPPPFLSSQLLPLAASFPHLLFVRHKADYTFQHSYSSKRIQKERKKKESLGKCPCQVTMQIPVRAALRI